MQRIQYSFTTPVGEDYMAVSLIINSIVTISLSKNFNHANKHTLVHRWYGKVHTHDTNMYRPVPNQNCEIGKVFILFYLDDQ